MTNNQPTTEQPPAPKKSLFRRILKVFLWIFGIILGLVLLVFLLLQVPAVQQRVAREVEKIASSSLGTDVGIGALDVDFPSRIEIDNFYLNNPAGDSIARVGHLGVGINMLALFKKKIQLTDIVLRDVYANVITTDSTSNIQFLLDMGAQDSSAVVMASDTALTEDTSGGGFEVAAAGAELILERADIYYQDDPAGILADIDARRLAGKVNDVDLEGQVYDINYLELEGANALVGIGPSSTPVDTTVTTAAAMQLKAGRVTIEKSNFDLRMEGQNITTQLPYVNLEGADLVLGEELRFNGEVFQVKDLGFTLDADAPALEGPGMDYNHLALTDVQAEATDVAYIVDSLHLRLRQLSGKEKSGLVLEKTEGTVVYDPNFLSLQDFVLRTSNTEIRSDNTEINYDFAGGDLEDMIARLQLEGYVGLRDVAYLAPDMLQTSVIARNLNQKVQFSARANGTMAAMDLSRIKLDGPGIKIRATGRVENALDPKRIAGRLNLAEFSIVPGPLLPLVPAGMLPPDIDWPQKIVAEGRADYRNDRLQLNLYALETRTFGNGLESRVKTNGVIEGVQSFPRTRLDVSLDTLLATKATILAYVPPGSIPEDYKLPDFIRGSGTVSGPMNDLIVNIRLGLPNDSTYASINGNIENALDPDNLNIDLNVSDLAIHIADIEAILPDSTLPANINIPDLRIRQAKISGSPTNLTFDIPMETDNGNWKIAGRYNPQDLDVSVDVTGVRVAKLFTGAIGDTLATLDLGPLSISAKATGQLEPAMDLNVTASIGETDGVQYLDLLATVRQDFYEADFNITHPSALALGQAVYAIGEDSIARVKALVDVNRLDLEYWEITQVPMLVEGRLEADVQGLDPYNMVALARLDSVRLRGAEGSSYVDSLVIDASLVDMNNEVYIKSDVLDAELLGRFDPLKTPEKMVNFIMAYWDEDLRQPDPVENGEELDFAMQLKRPQPLTGGLITGLTKLSQFSASFLYRDGTPQLLFNFSLPEIEYIGLAAHDLQMKAIGDLETLTFEANWSDIQYGDQVGLGRTALSAESVDDQLLVELKLYSTEDSLRHYLGFVTDPEAEEFFVQLEPEQILNFETWTVPVDNRIVMAGTDLTIEQFELRNGGQSLTARTDEPNNVIVNFNDFDLRTPSRLLQSEEEFIGGILNGRVELDNVLSNLGIQTDLRVDDFAYTGTKVGDIAAKIGSSDEQTYNVDVAITDEGNDATVKGSVVLDGPVDLTVDLNKFQLTSVEPFSIGYLQNSEGYLAGQIKVGGTLVAPSLNGQVAFKEASTVISLLGERFRMDDKPITFRDKTISFGDNWQIFDSKGGTATVRGNVVMTTPTDIDLDVRVVADNFLAINSTEEQNKDWFGEMYVDATVEISGTALLPIVNIVATTASESEVTYIYRLLQQGLVESEGIVTFEEQYRWRDILRRDTMGVDTNTVQVAGMDMTLDLAVDPNLEVTVVVDPVTGQTFVGRAEGDLTMRIFPDGRMEASGRVELTEGKYDFIYQGFINKEFIVLPGSNVSFQGDLENPIMDLRIRHVVEATPLPLVQGVQGGTADLTGLRRDQTFYVDITMKGDMQASDITTNVTYPEDAYGNLGLAPIENSLATLRQDQSRLTTTAFQLLAFGGFNVPLLDSGGGGGGPGLAATTLTGLMDNYLNSFADQLVGFVDLDFGLDNYEDEGGKTQTNLRVSLRKTLFDDRVVISVDGVAGTSDDELAGTQSTYLDNITAEYLINEDGTFRLKLFNDRDRTSLIGGNGNVLRFGGRLTFGKDFERLGWSGKSGK
ncbi:translocation/assembly module TamB domain-containing protein [Neolewinella antarctica]|uniref:Translocation and assembly module TamB C-terminal domain-containing protein n=1 Tax=Neolewinella antarctica TaxID=442734 RepID=A0ABX0XAR8_9BACT|nr:translocation/assembly module TamB domain-containing protein [Neolewinella antarctica]NJC26379.1 hypothetical protein [Neolewinella antarctica]